MTKFYAGLKNSMLVTVFSMMTIAAFAQVIYVDHLAVGAETGTSWADAYSDLNFALSNAVAGDSIWVAMGVYTPDATDRSIYFDIPDDIKVFGGFTNTATTFTDRNWENNSTTLSGDINTQGDHTDNSFTVVFTSNTSSATEVDGFTIEHGSADDGASIHTGHKKGGGWYNLSTLSGFNSAPIIRNCIFDSNYADKFGGALYNQAQGGSEASPIIINCVFSNNESDARGGAITNDGDSSPKILYSAFDNNNSIEGGAIFNNGHGNIASPTILNTIFSNNYTPINNHGGAIYNFGKGSTGEASPQIVNTLFYDNSAGHGGAIYGIATDFGTVEPQIINNTFHGNHADQNAGAIYASESLYGTNEVHVFNTIFWDNTNGSTGGPTFHFSGTNLPEISLTNVLVDTTSCALLHHSSTGRVNCISNILYNVDPNFVDQANFDFRLMQNSPAINQGVNMFIPADACDLDGDGDLTEQIDLDLDINPRFDGASIDLGPFEKVGGLPIELLSFDVRFDGKKVDLYWVTLSETGNDYFTIERSSNGVDFIEITREQGAGDSELARNYMVHDSNPATGMNYYRLKQTDFDGSYAYSEIRSVEIRSGFEISTFPNPVATELNISLTDFDERTIDFEIYHISGVQVYAGQADVNDGLVIVSLDNISGLQPGPYMIRITNTNEGDLYGQFIKVGL